MSPCSPFRFVRFVEVIQIILEVLRQLHNSPQMIVRDQDGSLVVLLSIVLRQGDGSLERYWVLVQSFSTCIITQCMDGLTISDLPTVPLDRPELRALQVLLRSGVQSHRATTLSVQLVDKILPDLLTLLVGKVLVVQLDVDSRGKGIVEGADPVGREEQDAVVELQSTQEACKQYC